MTDKLFKNKWFLSKFYLKAHNIGLFLHLNKKWNK
jgi:hypothetical protein